MNELQIFSDVLSFLGHRSVEFCTSFSRVLVQERIYLQMKMSQAQKKQEQTRDCDSEGRGRPPRTRGDGRAGSLSRASG